MNTILKHWISLRIRIVHYFRFWLYQNVHLKYQKEACFFWISTFRHQCFNYDDQNTKLKLVSLLFVSYLFKWHSFKFLQSQVFFCKINIKVVTQISFFLFCLTANVVGASSKKSKSVQHANHKTEAIYVCNDLIHSTCNIELSYFWLKVLNKRI